MINILFLDAIEKSHLFLLPERNLNVLISHCKMHCPIDCNEMFVKDPQKHLCSCLIAHLPAWKKPSVKKFYLKCKLQNTLNQMIIVFTDA